MTALTGKTIAVPETRELDVFASLLERRGARVWRCPLVGIVAVRDPQPVLSWMRSVSAGGCDDLILLTGEGLRRLLRCADQHDPALRPRFVEAIARCRIITRGPKPARALKELGLSTTLAAAAPTTAGVIATLSHLSLAGRRVGVQLYGTEPNVPLMDYLRDAGAIALPVAPYEYADAAADDAVRELLGAMESGQIDAIAFTSKSQVERLFKLVGPDSAVRALGHTLVAAIGPVVAASLQERGVKVSAMPAAAYFMKPMATELVALFSDTSGAGSP